MNKLVTVLSTTKKLPPSPKAYRSGYGDYHKHAAKVARGIKSVTSDEMLDFLKEKTDDQIYEMALNYSKHSGKLSEALILAFPRRINKYYEGLP